MIRRATIDDIRPIYDMLEAYYKEAMQTLHLRLNWDREKVVIQLGTWLSREEFNINLISDDGFMLGEVQETWFGGDRMGKPHILYVKPEHRNGLLARALIIRFEAQCKMLGALAIVWDNWAGITPSTMLDSLMLNFGYHKRGGVYSKVLDRSIYGSVSANPDDCRR